MDILSIATRWLRLKTDKTSLDPIVVQGSPYIQVSRTLTKDYKATYP